MPFSTPPTPTKVHPGSTARIAKQIAKHAGYLDHNDPAVRLVGLRAIQGYIDAVITQEYATVRPTATPQPEPHWVRELVRRFLP